MKDMIGCCGLNCTKCGAYVATQTDDDAKREEVAREWTQTHGGSFTADQINCDGCQANGKAPDWVAKMCPIHKCCAGKAQSTCADCTEYACEDLSKFHPAQSDPRKNLDALRK
ncbi:hypothetical protein LCGC14_1153400 [marine sediment metagenome]|uniref:DUF3795 domain-containing protein n=1 Tax=marine sediment metagenome TaxID=412755 RepID=A0A0F9MI06_9ZZZZ